MKIGIISDTHDNIPKIKSAVKIFKEKSVGLILHAGDFIAPFSLVPIIESSIEWYGVFGNNNGEKTGLMEKSKGKIKQGPWEILVDNKRILLGHNIAEISQRFSGYDIIICGHTHNLVVEKQDNTLIINPGECGGWLYEKSTVVLLDTEDMQHQICEV